MSAEIQGSINRLRFRVLRLLELIPIPLITLISVGVIAANLYFIMGQVRRPYPIDQWEASATVVATRVGQGEPMYARMNEPRSIEPGLYAPGQVYLLAGIFRITGPQLWAFRALNLAAGAVFILCLLRAFGLDRRLWTALLGAAVLLGVDRQLTGLWELPRLDAILALFGLLYVLAAWRAVSRDSIRWGLVSLAILLVGFFWKQTIIGLSPAPFVASLFVRPRASRRIQAFYLLAVPLLLGCTVAAIALLSPNMFEAVFRTGAQFRVQPRWLALFAYNLANSTPLLWFTAAWIVARPERFGGAEPNRFTWALAVFITSLPLGFAAGAKVGGGPNSFVFFLYAAYGIFLACVPRLADYLSSREEPLAKRLILSTILGIGLIWTTANILHLPTRVVLGRWYGDHGRAEILRLARELPGKVVCPQDPTIPLFARGYAGATVANEWDRRIWKWPLPKVVQEMEEADYVITWGRPGTTETWTFDDGLLELERLGYQRQETPTLEGSGYSIWRRPKTSSPK